MNIGQPVEAWKQELTSNAFEIVKSVKISDDLWWAPIHLIVARPLRQNPSQTEEFEREKLLSALQKYESRERGP